MHPSVLRLRARPLPLLAAVALLAAAPSLSSAADEASPEEPRERPDEPPPELPPPPQPPEPSEEAPAGDRVPEVPAEEETWLDVGHAFVEQRLFAPVLRLDRFFSDERDIEAERARSFLRWRNEVRFSADTSRPVFTTGVRANLRLPGLNKQLRRLRVVIAGETRDAISTLFPPEPGEEDAVEDDIGSGDAGLRFLLWDTLVSHGDIDGGFLARLPIGGFGRLRFRFAYPLGNRVLGRAAASGFWRSDTRFGTSLSADLERPLSPVLVVRLAGDGTLTEVSRGVEWNGDLSVRAALGSRSGAQVGVSVTGASEAAPEVDRYRAYTRLRRDFYRRWLFLEIEPEVAWPWTIERGRHAVWGVALRLEVQFRGREAPPAPRPPPPPEPEDPPEPGEG